MYDIDKLSYLQIGVQGDNESTDIVIDVSAWAEKYPEAEFFIVFKPYNAQEISPMETSYEDGILTWTVNSAATAVTGVGYTEVRAQDSHGLIKKSRIIPTAVENSVSGVDDTPPAAYQEWVTAVLNAGAVSKNAAAAAMAVSEGRQIRFEIGTDESPTGTSGHLLFYYRDDDDEWAYLDLGAVDAYGMAKAGGYTGTKAEFEEDMGESGTNATAAATSAENAEAYAIGKRNGEDVTSGDAAYHNNSKYWSGIAEAAAATASAAYGTDLLAPAYTSLSFPVKKGDHCIYSGAYYEANQDIATSENWTAAHWTQVTVGGESSVLKSTLEQQNNAQTGICGKEYQDRNGFIQKNKEQDLKIGSLEVNEQRFKQALTPVWHELQNTDENEIWIANNTWISVVVYECRDNRLIGYVEELTATDEALSDRINANAEEIEDAEERVNTRIDELHKDDFDPFKVGLPVLKMFGDFNTMTKSSGKTIEYYYYKTGSQLINNRELLTTIELIASGTGNCKWQGQSSINLPKKNFTVTFSKPISHEGWFMGRKAVLKGNYNDATFARNVVSAKLWGDVVRSRSDIDTSPILDTDSNELLIEADNPVLIYAVPLYGCVNGAAIDGFPILVEINGEYAGIYDFTLKKGEKETTFMGGNQYEAVVGAEVDSEPVRFRAEAACDGTDFEIEYASDNFTDEAIAESINAAIDACLNHASTEQEYRDNVCTKIDIDSAIDYWIFSQLIQNWDGVSKNYLLITYDGTKWYFSAYDLDHTFGNIILNKEVPKVDKANTGFMYFANINRLFNRISKYDMDKVIARFNELVEGALSENNIMVSFSSFIGSIPKLAVDKETHVWPLEYWSNMQTYDQITNFYRLRKDYIRKQVAELAEGE